MWLFHFPLLVLMSSVTGMLSTTDHSIPAAWISAFLRSISSTDQATPLGRWCRAVTIPLAPACRACVRGTESLGPNQRQHCCIGHSPPFRSAGRRKRHSRQSVMVKWDAEESQGRKHDKAPNPHLFFSSSPKL